MAAEMDKIVLEFTKDYVTKHKIRYNEEIGEIGWSEKDVAVGYMYPYKDAMELIGNPERIRVTIEPI